MCIRDRVSTDTEVQFTLREYNAELESLTVEEFTDFIFEPQKTEYTVFNTKGAEKISLAPKAVIPGAKITVDGEALETAGAEIPLRDGEAVVKIRVNDGIKNTLNDKWAEKEYTISVLTSLDSLKEAIDDLPGADSIDKDNYQQYKNTVSSLTAACDALSDQQREQIGQTSIQKLALVSEKISFLSLEAAKEKAAAELEAYQDEEGDYTCLLYTSMDMVEVSPPNDNNGITCMYAAQLMLDAMSFITKAKENKIKKI